MDALAAAPGIKVVGSNNGDYDEAKGMQVMEDFLTRLPSRQESTPSIHTPT